MNEAGIMLGPQCAHRNKIRREFAAEHDSLRSRPYRCVSAQDMRNTASISRRDPLCGWELNQLFLLHDDSGIVEWFSEKEHQIFSNGNKTGWSCSVLGYVPFSDNRVKITHNDLPEIDAFSEQLQQTNQRRNDFSNLLKKTYLENYTTKRKTSEEKEEMKFYSSKPSNKVNKANLNESHHGHNSERTSKETQLADGHCEDINQVSKMRNLERKFATSRTSKIERRVEGLRQPLITKTTGRLLRRELFNPSVISVISDTEKDLSLSREDKWEKRRTITLCKKFLQLLPVDRAVKSMDLFHPIKTKTVLPTLEVRPPLLIPKISCACDQLKLNSKFKPGMLSQKAIQNNFIKSSKSQFSVQQQQQQQQQQQMGRTLPITKEHVCKKYEDPEQLTRTHFNSS